MRAPKQRHKGKDYHKIYKSRERTMPEVVLTRGKRRKTEKELEGVKR